MSEWTDAETAVAEVIWTASRADESTISATGANHVARAVLASGVVVPARVVEEAERQRDNAQRVATMYQRQIKSLRSAVEALADEWERSIRQGHEDNPDGHHALTIHERDYDELRALLLAEGRDRAGEGAGS